jgi:hypothetical protein
MNAPHINELRQQLMATLADLRNRENPMDPKRAVAIAQVAGVLVDSAKVEIEYLKATGQDRSNFLELPADAHVVRLGAETAGLPNGISSIVRHRI